MVGVQLFVIAGLISVVISLGPLRQLFCRLLSVPNQPALLGVIGMLILLDCLASDCSRYLFARKAIEAGNVVNVLQTSLWAAAVFVLFLLWPAHLHLAAIITLWGVGLALAVGYGIWRSGPAELWRAPFRTSYYPVAVRFGLPIVLTASILLANNLGRFILAGRYASEVVGIFTFHHNLMLMIAGMSSPLVATPLDPYIIEAHNTGQRQRSGYLLAASLRYRVMVLMPLLIVATLWSGTLIRLMAKADYAAAPHLLLWLAPVPLLMALSGAYERVLFLQRRTALIGRWYVAAAAVQLAAYVLCVPWHPYAGAALATDLGLATLVVLLWLSSRQADIRVEVPWLRMGLAAIPCVVLTWILGRLWAGWPGLVSLGLVTLAAVASYAVCCDLFGVVPEEERRALFNLLRQGGSTVRTVLAGGVSR